MSEKYHRLRAEDRKVIRNLREDAFGWINHRFNDYSFVVDRHPSANVRVGEICL